MAARLEDFKNLDKFMLEKICKNDQKTINDHDDQIL